MKKNTPIEKNLGISVCDVAQRGMCVTRPAHTLIIGHGGLAVSKAIQFTERERDNMEIEEMSDEQVQEKIQTGELAVRHLTARECWRLMDLCERTGDTVKDGQVAGSSFDDSNFEKARTVCSESQLYKQAGNSICVGVLEAIFENILSDAPKTSRQRTLDF